jgi:REP element-mobilizing transposase RayT
MAIHENKHRLSLDNYIGSNIIAFTCCVFNKRRLFNNNTVFLAFEAILLDSLEKHGCNAYVYLFMPDHGHLILQGEKDDSDLWTCMVYYSERKTS